MLNGKKLTPEGESMKSVFIQKSSCFFIVISLCSSIFASELSISDVKQQLADIDARIEKTMGTSHIFDPQRQKENIAQRDILFQNVRAHIATKLKTMEFDVILPFFRSDIAVVRDIACNEIKKSLLVGDIDLSRAQRKCFDFLLNNSDEDHGLLLLEICSKANSYEAILKEKLKDIFIKKNLLPFLLEFEPALYQVSEIRSLFNIEDEKTLSKNFQMFASAKKQLDFASFFDIVGLILLARNGDVVAYQKYVGLAASMKGPVSYKILAGYAIISSRESFEYLFKKQSDFNKNSYSGHPVSLSVTGVLYKTLVDFPRIETNWIRFPFTKEVAQKYTDWVIENKNSYKIKKLSPYELYLLLGVRISQ